MVKRNRQKPAPPTHRTAEEAAKRRTTVEEADAKWIRQEAARKLADAKALESHAIEEAFISYSPMSDIVNDEAEEASVDAILPYEETMSDAGRNSEDGISAGNSIGDVGKPARNNIENNRSDTHSMSEDTFGNPINTSIADGKRRTKADNATRSSAPLGTSTAKASGVVESTFSQDDFATLERLRNIPLERLTGSQQEELHNVFYKKHAERNIRYMNRKWERPLHAYFESLIEVEEDTLVESSFLGGFTPIHHPPQRESDAQIRESTRHGLEETVTTTRYIPTTRDVLDMYDKVKRDRDRTLTDETLSRSSRASSRPETNSPAFGKRLRGDSPLRGQIITSVAASDFTAMEDEITPEMATNFERRVGRLPTGTTVTDCVVGKAFTSLDTRLRTDRDQDFVDSAYFDDWRTIISLNTLSRMIMKYYGPQTETSGTIEQEIRRLPFEFNYADHSVLEDTIHAHKTAMETYVRRNGKLTKASQKALAAQIEKRMAPENALYMDYKMAKVKDSLKEGFEDTWQGALWRWATVIQEVRDIVAIASRYGDLKDTRTHTYRDNGSAEDVGTMDIRKTTSKLGDTRAPARPALKTTSTSFATSESSTGQRSTALDKPIAKRAPEANTTEGRNIFVTGVATCNRCGQTGHRAETCPFIGAQDTNARTEHTWSESLIGQMWKKCGHSCFQPAETLPEIAETYKARNERNLGGTFNARDNTNNNRGGPDRTRNDNDGGGTDNRNHNNNGGNYNRTNDNRNDSGGGYKKPYQKAQYNYNGASGGRNYTNSNSGSNNNREPQHQQNRCKVSHHVLAALRNATPNPDFMSAHLFLLQQMSRRGATTMATDPTEAPPNSVLAQVLLDSGSLAGDFISRDMLLRLQGERHVYKTVQPFTVCSGMDGACVTHYEMLDIGMVFRLHSGINKLIRLSVRINNSSSCDLIIGRKGLNKHNLYRFIPGAFGEHDTDPEIPFDELRWINDTNNRKKLIAATSTPPTLSTDNAILGEQENPTSGTSDTPSQVLKRIIPPSQTRVDVTAIPTLAPEGTEDALIQTVSQTGSSVGNQLPCVCQGSHGLANCVPNTTERPKMSTAARKRKRQADRAYEAAQAANGQPNRGLLSAMTEQDNNEDLSPMTWNPSRVILAVDDIDNDKTDTFAPFLTNASPSPATSFLDEITFGGDASLQSGLRALCSEYADIFSDTLPKKAADLKPFEINVDKAKWEQDSNRTPTRPQSSKKMTEIKKHIDDMMKSGIIEKAETPYYSHPVIVQKTETSFRFCIDYRGLNAATESASWPLPNITQLFDRICAHRPDTFGVMDLTSGYHQAPLALSARKFTAFLCFAGLFQFTRLPFGPKRAPSYFQEQMVSDVLAGLVYVICEIYLDDIIIYANGNEEFIIRTRQVFERLRIKGVRLKAKKTKLGLPKIEYVGKEISVDGMSMSTNRIKAFLDIPRPKTITDLRKFLGVANYFHQFIANHSAVVQHLHALIKPKLSKYTSLVWTTLGQTAFESLRELIANCPLLRFPDDSSPIILRTDASDFGIGGILFQTIEGVENPIAFVSKSLTDVQLRWSVIQKEAYAVFYCCTQLDYLLRDRRFIIETDHRNLTYMQKNTNSMVIRWDIAIQELDFTIRFIKGKDNEIADSMSRLCTNLIVDVDLMQSAIYILSDVTGDQLEGLQMCHNSKVGHGGVDRTIAYLKRLGYFWPSMRRDTKQFIKTCPCCQKMESSKRTVNTMKFTTSTYEPWTALNMDFIGPYSTGEYVHVIIDTATRWTELTLCKDATASSAALALLNHLGRYGTPQHIRSDRGPHFANAVIKEFMALTGTQLKHTLAYSSEENAIVERANREVNRHLRAMIFDEPDVQKLPKMLPFVMRIMNTTRNAVTGIAPSELMYGKMIDLDEGILLPRSERPQFASLSEASSEMIRIQDDLWNKSRELRLAADKTHLATQSAEITSFPIDSYVLASYVVQPPTRLHTKWSGPFKVLGNQNSEYRLFDLVTKKEKLVHVTRLKEFIFNPHITDPKDIARRDYLEYFVESIVDHRGSTSRKSELHFYVKWLNYSEEHNTWEPWANLRLVDKLHDYLRANNMDRLIPR